MDHLPSSLYLPSTLPTPTIFHTNPLLHYVYEFPPRVSSLFNISGTSIFSILCTVYPLSFSQTQTISAVPLFLPRLLNLSWHSDILISEDKYKSKQVVKEQHTFLVLTEVVVVTKEVEGEYNQLVT